MKIIDKKVFDTNKKRVANVNKDIYECDAEIIIQDKDKTIYLLGQFDDFTSGVSYYITYESIFDLSVKIANNEANDEDISLKESIVKKGISTLNDASNPLFIRYMEYINQIRTMIIEKAVK